VHESDLEPSSESIWTAWFRLLREPYSCLFTVKAEERRLDKEEKEEEKERENEEERDG